MKSKAIGIDLGTTFSAMATINAAGKPEIVANKEGDRITASAVYFQPDDSIIVGQIAADAALGDPKRVARWVKRHMGETDWQFEVNGKSYDATDISSIILKKIWKDGQNVLGDITDAVITVPAYFDEVRRQATIQAATQAGINVLRIINEPTAAALAYASFGDITGKCLIYDFGGGTFDVSIVEISSDSEITVLASEGDHQLGGHDIDKALANYFNQEFMNEHGVPILGENASDEYRTLVEAEAAKKKLSSVSNVGGIALNSRGKWSTLSVQRAKFEEAISELITRTEMLTENALDSASCKSREIDHVILAGGSTRIPAVQQMLKKKFGDKLLNSINPDEAVALGASLQAGVILESKGKLNLSKEASEELNRTQISDITNHSFGTLALCEVYGEKATRNVIVIPKGTKIPCKHIENLVTVYDGQTTVECSVTQGEDEDPEFVNIIAQTQISLPEGRESGQPIKVTYSYDSNGCMSCTFLDERSGRFENVDLDITQTSSGLNLDEIDFDDLDIE